MKSKLEHESRGTIREPNVENKPVLAGLTGLLRADPGRGLCSGKVAYLGKVPEVPYLHALPRCTTLHKVLKYVRRYVRDTSHDPVRHTQRKLDQAPNTATA